MQSSRRREVELNDKDFEKLASRKARPDLPPLRRGPFSLESACLFKSEYRSKAPAKKNRQTRPERGKAATGGRVTLNAPVRGYS